MKKLNEIIYAHDIARMPREVAKRKNLIILVSIFSTALLDIISFSIRGAQSALSADMKLLALILMVLYFLRHLISKSIQTLTDDQKTIFSQQSDGYITENISNVADTVRGKVFHKKSEFWLLMTNPEVTFNLKEYIRYVWDFLRTVPILIVDSISALIISIAIGVSEFLQTGDLKLTISLFVVLIMCIFIFALLYKIRLKVKKTYRDKHRELRKENEVLINDVKNIEPLIKNEYFYRVQLVVSNLRDKRKLEKTENFKLNCLQVLRALVLALFMLFMVVIKLYFAGGINSFSLVLLTDILAISAVFSNILDKVTSILDNFENISNTVRDAERVKPDVDNIMDVFEKENATEFASPEDISKIVVGEFEFAYAGAMSVYKLRNFNKFELERGKSYLVYGHTGCGKSTLMHLLVGKIRMDISPISYGENCSKAYLSSIMHESNGQLGSNPVLQELIFSQDTSNVDFKSLIEILHGTHIYEDVKRNIGITFDNDVKILEYLNSTTIEQYSSGQKQRLSIVKLLYNLSTSHQIVVFDEATNALDDETAVSVLNFMVDYCQRDIKRIVMFVSHQVDLVKEIADGSITFVSETFPVFDIVTEL